MFCFLYVLWFHINILFYICYCSIRYSYSYSLFGVYCTILHQKCLRAKYVAMWSLFNVSTATVHIRKHFPRTTQNTSTASLLKAFITEM